MDGCIDLTRMTDTRERDFTDEELNGLSNDSLWCVWKANSNVPENQRQLTLAMKVWDILHKRGLCPAEPPLAISV